MRAAVIGIGSNSVRMLVADVQGGRLLEVLRDREGTRLFGGLNENGNLSRESMNHTLSAVRQMQQKAMVLNAQALHLFATSAVRDAGNQQEFSSLIRNETGLELEICSGESEAALSFLGSTFGERSGVIDIGGGSTEYVIGCGTNIECGVSLQMGAVRLYRLYPIHSAKDLPRVLDAARAILHDGIGPLKKVGLPQSWVGVGGTSTALAGIIKGISWTEKTKLHGFCLKKEQVEEWLCRLADMSLAERLKLPGLQPQRADIMVHGTAILAESIRQLGIESIEVSEFGNLDGYLKQKYMSGESL
jgi:exopolyphosphatase/guanosine-5'-triphosphate,3'-diphosphate pyrophosphatase